MCHIHIRPKLIFYKTYIYIGVYLYYIYICMYVHVCHVCMYVCIQLELFYSVRILISVPYLINGVGEWYVALPTSIAIGQGFVYI